jgi:hypothetical protein
MKRLRYPLEEIKEQHCMKRDDVMKVEAGGRGHGALVHSSNVHHPYCYHGIVMIL